jgi:hypothetical protein
MEYLPTQSEPPFLMGCVVGSSLVTVSLNTQQTDQRTDFLDILLEANSTLILIILYYQDTAGPSGRAV